MSPIFEIDVLYLLMALAIIALAPVEVSLGAPLGL